MDKDIARRRQQVRNQPIALGVVMQVTAQKDTQHQGSKFARPG
jgi:hypothetical protein